MSLLSMPNEILLNYILSCIDITISDLFQLMLSCCQLRDIIFNSRQLWMCKISARWPEMYIKIKEKKEVPWQKWVLSLRLIEELKNTAISLSSQCYPFGKPAVSSVLAFEKWVVEEKECAIPVFPEEELHKLVFTEEITSDLTHSYYASVALKKLLACLQMRNLNTYMEKTESQKTLLAGAKLISKWFYFCDDKANRTNKLVNNVEECLQEMVKRVLVWERNSTVLEDILTCINNVLFGEMRFRVYKGDDFRDWNHEAASIHWVLKNKIGYSAVLSVIFLEVAIRLGITCELIFLDCSFAVKFFIRCRFLDKADVFHVCIREDSLTRFRCPYPANQSSITQPVNSFEIFFGQMLEDVVVRDERTLIQTDLRALTSMRLACAISPSKVNVLKFAKLCLQTNHQVEDAHHLLLSAEIDSNESVMIDVVQRLRSQQSLINVQKVVRHWLPSIVYAVGLVVRLNLPAPEFSRIYRVIVSWDECFREELSRSHMGLSFEPITNGYRLDQPFFHIVSFRPFIPFLYGKNYYVPKEKLELAQNVLSFNDQISNVSVGSYLGIFFERFDGRRYVPNAQHNSRFPEDNAAASSLIKQIHGVDLN